MDRLIVAGLRLGHQRGDVLDEQGHLRVNVAVFIHCRLQVGRIALSGALRPDSTVHVLQALSGG